MGQSITVNQNKGSLKLAENQMRLETPTEAQANLVFTESGFGNIIIKMHKNSGE